MFKIVHIQCGGQFTDLPGSEQSLDVVLIDKGPNSNVEGEVGVVKAAVSAGLGDRGGVEVVDFAPMLEAFEGSGVERGTERLGQVGSGGLPVDGVEDGGEFERSEAEGGAALRADELAALEEGGVAHFEGDAEKEEGSGDDGILGETGVQRTVLGVVSVDTGDEGAGY